MLVLPGLGQLIGFRFRSLLQNFLDIFLLIDTVIYVHVLCVFIFLCHSMELPLCIQANSMVIGWDIDALTMPIHVCNLQYMENFPSLNLP